VAAVANAVLTTHILSIICEAIKDDKPVCYFWLTHSTVPVLGLPQTGHSVSHRHSYAVKTH